MSYTLDTNILIYSIDRGNPQKRHRAESLVAAFAQKRGSIPLQCLNEFYSATTRKRLLTPPEAEGIVRRLILSANTVGSSAPDSREAMRLHQIHGIQYFDALLIATAIRAGCTTFLSEDLQDGQIFDSLTIRNPFRMTELELSTLLA